MIRIVATLAALCALLVAAPARAEHLRDLAEVAGARDNQLLGYGLVTGLNGTGDDVMVPFTGQTVLSMLRRLGILADPRMLRLRNVAAVVVTATVAPFARPGTRLDVTVSSIGNARSLQGGVLVLTILKGVDQRPYAIAQGPLLVGGFEAHGSNGSSVRVNTPTAARIPNGALMEHEIATTLVEENHLRMVLRTPGFTVASRIATAINARYPAAAAAEDAGSVRVALPEGEAGQDVVGFIAALEDLEVVPVRRARVVINERTGTLAAGGDVRLSPVAVVHGALTIVVRESTQVSQPGAPLTAGARTAVVQQSDVTAQEGRRSMAYIPAAATLSDVATALGALGLSPRELAGVLDALRGAGALEAEVVLQ